MAEFGVQATTLSAPQGAGTEPLNPVRPAQQTNVFAGLTAVGDIFAKGLSSHMKAQADERQNTILGEYIRHENTLSDAVAQGGMSAAEAAARSRANFRKVSSSYPEYIQEFEKAGKALRGFTESGEVVDEVKRDRQIRDKDISDAKANGFSFVPGMTKQEEDAQIKASQAGIKATKDLQAYYAKNAELRAQGTFDAAVAAREEKKLAFDTINMVAGENLTAFQNLGASLSAAVKRGDLTKEQADFELNKRFTNITSAITAGAGTNPELAGAFRGVFDEVYKLNQKALDPLDPKNKLQDLKDQYEMQVVKLKLIAMSDPKVAAAVVGNVLLPNNASLALSSAPAGVRAIAILSDTKVGERNPDGTVKYVPTVVGDPEVEASALKLLKQGLADLKSGKISQKEVGTLQASNSVNHILKQTGALINQGDIDPRQLKGVAEFFASPEYASFIQSGALEPQAAQTAKKTFQLIYEPAIIGGVQRQLSVPLDKGTSFAGRERQVKATEPTPVADVVNIKFSGSGILFEPKAKAGLMPGEYRDQVAQIETLNSSQRAINQLIHIGAHMEGHTDYAKYWEEHKHEYVPGYFMKGLKEGDERQGYIYLGGNASSQSSWKKKPDATSK